MGNVDLYYEIPELSVTADLMYIRAATAPQNAWIDYYNFKALEVKSDWAIDPWWRELYKAHPFKAGIITLSFSLVSIIFKLSLSIIMAIYFFIKIF